MNDKSNAMNDLTERLDGICRAFFPDDQPGAAVLVAQGDNILFDRGYGLADLSEKTPADGDMFFNIASCSKQFTAIAVLQLAEKGLLKLTDCVHRYFPEFESNIWDKVTIGQLLNHSSGVPDGRGYLTREEKILCDDNRSCEFMKTIDRLNFEPGTAYEYMNPTFTLCGHLIERVSGQPFADYMRDNIFTPAGMKETLYFDPKHQELIPRRAHGYDRENAGSAWEIYEYGQETCFATRPDGGIYTSTHEALLWEKALRDDLLVSRESRLLAHSPQTYVSGSPYSGYQNRPNTWYGLGWFIEPATDNCPTVVYHTGDNGGFKALTARYPDSETAVFVFSNRPDWDRYALKTQIETTLGLRK